MDRVPDLGDRQDQEQVATEHKAEPGRSALVGRDREIRTLLLALDDSVSGHGRLVLIGGDPGIGKTRLADELATAARNQGHQVLWGRAWEDAGAPPFWPWVQALRSYLSITPTETIRRQVGHGAVDIAQVLPEISRSIGDSEPALVADPAAARFRLFDAMATFLITASQERPIVLVLDDLHAADAPSILLLRFLGSQVGNGRLLLVATYRDAELTPGHPLTGALVELAREPTTRMLALGGLVEGAVGEFIEGAAGARPRRGLVSSLTRLTAGNPLFLGEAVRLLGADGGIHGVASLDSLPLSVPPSIRDVIARRVSPLGESVVTVLRVAAAIGPEFSLETLALLLDDQAEQLLDILEPAVRAGLLVDLGATTRFRFGHDLVRETLYDELPSVARVRLHRRIAETLERQYASRGDAHLAELAYHFSRGLSAGNADKAADFATRAGREAADALSYEEAARLFRLALGALEAKRPPDDARRCGLLLLLGDAEARGGDLDGARDAFLGAATIARATGEADELAHAALGYGGRFIWARAGADPHLVPLLLDALSLMGSNGDPRLRVRLMARLACAWRSSTDHRGDSDRLSREALELAHGLDDPATLSYALVGRFWATYWPENPVERLEIATELLAVAQASRDAERTFDGHQALLIAYSDLGRMADARAEAETARRAAVDLRQPPQVWAMPVYRIVGALLSGTYGLAEELIQASADSPEINLIRDNVSTMRMHLFLLRREQARSAEIEADVRAAIDMFPWYPYFRAALVCLLLDTGRADDARAVFEELARDDFSALYRDCEWLLAIGLASEACARLEANGEAETLYRLLLPFAGRHAVAHAEGSLGSVDRYLGLLAATLGRFDDADRHFRAGVEINEQLGASPWAAHTMVDWARLLRQRAQPGDLVHADQLLQASQSIVGRLGMTALAVRIDAGGDAPSAAVASGRVQPTVVGAATHEPSVPGACVFLREGEYWTVVFGGVSCRLRDAKGLRYLARLLAAPAREIHAIDLARSVGPAGSAAAAAPRSRGWEVESMDTGDAGEVLDDAARRAYRERLADIEHEIGEAEDWNDPERAVRLREERSLLVQELAAAVGLGGRARVVGSASERARMSVAKAIRSAMTRIDACCPPLGQHLALSVRTGTFCSYEPDPGLAIAWSM
jgi:tetratricopeptide (TPR) repeat protein